LIKRTLIALLFIALLCGAGEAATEYPIIVDTDGTQSPDYTSLSAAEAGAQSRDYVTNDELPVIYCRATAGDADTSAVVVDGWPYLNSTHWLTITAIGAYRHSGVYDTNLWRLETSGTALTIQEDWVRVDGLQWYPTITTAASVIFLTGQSSSNHIEISNNIIRADISTGSGQGTGIFIYETTAAWTNAYIYNNIIYDIFNADYPNSTGQYGIYNQYGTAWLYNNTVYKAAVCYLNGSYTAYAVNNLADCYDQNQSYYTDFSGTFTSSDYNASTDTTAPGGNSQTEIDPTYEAEGADDFHLASGDTACKDNGTSDPGSGLFSDDIDGDTRSGSWDIGADEYVEPVSGFDAVIIKDTFTDDDATALTDHYGERSIWNTPAYDTGTDYINIDNNEVWAQRAGAGPHGNYRYITYAPPAADYSVLATINLKTSDGDAHGIIARMSLSQADGYLLVYRSDTGEMKLLRIDNGSFTQLGSTYSPGWAADSGEHTMMLVVEGSSIKGYADGTLQFDETDSTYSSAGYAGMRLVPVVLHDETEGFAITGIKVLYGTTPLSYSETGFSNPVFEPTGVSGDFDQVAVRDMYYTKTGNVFNLVYTGFPSAATAGQARVGLANTTTHGGTYTRQGMLLVDTLFVRDTLTEDDGTYLENHHPEQGLKYNGDGTDADWLKQSGDTIVISSNRAKPSPGTTPSLYYLPDKAIATKSTDRSNPSNEYDVVGWFYYNGDSIQGGIVGKFDPDNPTNFYSVQYNSSLERWELVKGTSGGPVVLGSYSQSLSNGQTYKVALKMRTSTTRLTVEIGDVSRITSDDSTYDSINGQVGIYLDGTGFELDKLEATEIGEVNSGDVWMRHDGTYWHMWADFSTEVYFGLTEYGRVQPQHFITEAPNTSIPTSGWELYSRITIAPPSTGWARGTAPTSNRGGLAAMKVVSKVGGGVIAFLGSEGVYAAEEHKIGYATASSEFGPWTLGDELMGTPGGYQPEQATPFAIGDKFYLQINRNGYQGQGGGDPWPDKYIDIWDADAQTGPYEMLEVDVVNRNDSSWASTFSGVLALSAPAGRDFSIEASIEGVYDGSDLTPGGANNIPRSIGALVMNTPGYDYVLYADGGAFTATGADSSSQVARAISVSGGDFAWIGSDASLKAGRAVQAGPGSHALTGSEAGLLNSRVFPVEAGDLTESGADALLRADRKISAGEGAFTETGADASLTPLRIVTADSGSYAFEGQAVTLKADRSLLAEGGAYTEGGSDATLTYSGPGGYSLDMGPGSYALAGGDAWLEYGREVQAETGSISETGSDIALRADRTLPIEGGSMTEGGSDASLEYGRELAPEAGGFAEGGQDSSLLADRALPAGSGGYQEDGQDATLLYSPVTGYILSSDPESYAETGSDVSLLKGSVALAEGEGFAENGPDAGLLMGYGTDAGAETFGLAGSDVSSSRTYVMVASAADYALGGSNAGMLYVGGTPVGVERVIIEFDDGIREMIFDDERRELRIR
jgi:hypothetical protein